MPDAAAPVPVHASRAGLLVAARGVRGVRKTARALREALRGVQAEPAEVDAKAAEVGPLLPEAQAAADGDHANAPADPVEALVHRLRARCRQTDAALRALGPLLGKHDAKRVRAILRRLRTLAGPARDADVHLNLLAPLAEAATHDDLAAALRAAVADLETARAVARKNLRRYLDKAFPSRELARASKRWRARANSQAPVRSAESKQSARLVRAALAGSLRGVARADASGLATPETLHALRVRIKHLRGTLLLLRHLGVPTTDPELLEVLSEAQTRLGDVNDLATLIPALTPKAPPRVDAPEVDAASARPPAQRERLLAALAHLLRLREEAARAWWHGHAGLAQRIARLSLADTAPPDPLLPFAAPPAGDPPMPTSNGAHRTHDAAAPASVTPAPAFAAPAPAAPVPLRAQSQQSELFAAGTRLAVIDIGSNSIRLLAVELIDHTSWTVLAEERAMTRLAHATGPNRELCAESMARSVEAIARFKMIAERLGATVRAFATAAVREAGNRADFLSLVADRAGLRVELVSPLDEGRHTYRSVARTFDLSHGLCGVVDLGGGSMEVVLSMDGVIFANSSTPLGAVRLTELFELGDDASDARWRRMKEHCDRHIARAVREPDGPLATLVGCGGTFTTLLTLAAAQRGVLLDRSSPALRELAPVTREELRAILKDLRSRSLAERLRMPGLPSDRADIVIAGLTAIDRLMRHLGVPRVLSWTGGVREGLLLAMIDDLMRAPAPRGAAQGAGNTQILAGVRDFAQRCRVERPHAEHVCRLALSLYDQLASGTDLVPRLGTHPGERMLLEAAALLHDAGIMVEYRSHHKHSATMIRHADLPGLSPRERELVALIARYHRRTPPRRRHASFAALSDSDQALVRRLAAILRVADGLDRTHAQVVQEAHARAGRSALTIEVITTQGAAEELRAASAKADLLQDVAGVPVHFRALAPASAT